MAGQISPGVYPELDEGVETTFESGSIIVISNEVRDLFFVVAIKAILGLATASNVGWVSQAADYS